MYQKGFKVKHENVISISHNAIRKLSNCPKSFQYYKTGINTDGYEQFRFTAAAISLLKNNLSKGAAEYEKTLVSFLEKDFKAEWFGCKPEYDLAYRTTKERLMRLAWFLETKNVKDVDVSYSRDLISPLEVHGEIVQRLSGKIDFVYEEEGKMVGAVIKYGTPKESSKAHKQDRLPENTVDLLALNYATRALFDENYRNELWYLKSKDDTSVDIVPEYEHRKEKNIITYDFSSYEDEQVLSRLKDVLSWDSNGDCSHCRYECICKSPTEIRNPKSLNELRKPNEKVERKYTSTQLKAIEKVNGPMCCVAVPGAGKTTCLVQRMVRLVVKHHVYPAKILMVTFTTKAAKEISERVDTELARVGVKGRPCVSTYNSLGFSILKENPMYVGRRIRLATDTDRYGLIYGALIRCPEIAALSYSHPFEEYGIVHTMDKFFEQIKESGEAVFIENNSSRYDTEGILRVYREYQAMYEKEGYIDFDMQISMVNEIFEEYPVIARKYADKFQYIMLDEFQDSCSDQVDMIYAIARYHKNIMVVGDDDQSIYRWRGGSAKYMLEFAKDFPGAEIEYMEDNFRSNDGILQLGSAYIQGNGQRFEKKLHSTIGEGKKPLYMKNADVSYVAVLVQEFIAHGCKPGEIAILARNNKRLDEVAQVLEGVCPVSLPKDYLVEDAVFTGIYDVMSMYYNGIKDIPFYRYARLLHAEHELKKANWNLSFYQDLVSRGVLTEIEMSVECVAAYEKKEGPLGEAIRKLLRCSERICYGQMKETLETITEALFGIREHPVVDALLEMAEDRGIVKTKELFAVMENMVRYHSTDRIGYDIDINSVNLLTCHDAKGKEFKNVIVYAMEDFKSSEEEVRVLYVAMTRAMNNLFMLESPYNHFEGFQKIAPYVTVRGGE